MFKDVFVTFWICLALTASVVSISTAYVCGKAEVADALKMKYQMEMQKFEYYKTNQFDPGIIGEEGESNVK